jgi:hypothetical protein
MRSPRRTLHRFARSIVLRYRLACARDDNRRHGVRVPTGLWVCGRCDHVSFDAMSLARHGCPTPAF